MKQLHNIKSFIFALLFIVNSTYCAHIIFDLGGVLIDTNLLKVTKEFGVYNFLQFAVHFNNPLNLRERFFTLLRKVPADSLNSYGAQDDTEKKLPPIMCDWLTGKKTNSQIKEEVYTFMEQNPQLCNKGEKELFKTIVDITFTPTKLTRIRTIVKESFSFAKTCKEQGHDLYILSNWDKESFALICERFPDLFDLFDKDNIIISGEIGLIKPDPKIYDYFLEKYGLDPQQCIFFDDQEVNVKAAQKAGIHGVLCKGPNYKDMAKAVELFMQNITDTPVNAAS